MSRAMKESTIYYDGIFATNICRIGNRTTAYKERSVLESISVELRVRNKYSLDYVGTTRAFSCKVQLHPRVWLFTCHGNLRIVRVVVGLFRTIEFIINKVLVRVEWAMQSIVNFHRTMSKPYMSSTLWFFLLWSSYGHRSYEKHKKYSVRKCLRLDYFTPHLFR